MPSHAVGLSASISFNFKSSLFAQIVASPIGGVMRHDAIVKGTRFLHQRIDVLGQQKTSSDDIGGGSSHVGLILGTIGVARFQRCTRVAGRLPLPAC